MILGLCRRLARRDTSQITGKDAFLSSPGRPLGQRDGPIASDREPASFSPHFAEKGVDASCSVTLAASCLNMQCISSLAELYLLEIEPIDYPLAVGRLQTDRQ